MPPNARVMATVTAENASASIFLASANTPGNTARTSTPSVSNMRIALNALPMLFSPMTTLEF